MPISWRHARFLGRWVFFYNAELIWLNWRLPRRIDARAALPPEADARRQEAHAQLAEATVSGNRACVNCGHCCIEAVNRFTPFDQIVRRQTQCPVSTASRQLYSVPWMIWNAVSHTAQRLLHRGQQLPAPTCPHLTAEGCSLPRAERPMVCVSWFCIPFALAMDKKGMDQAEAPMRVIETLHREATRAARKKMSRE